MTEDTGTTSSAVEPEASSPTRRIPPWVVAIGALGVVGVIGAILYYGYTTRPGWVGVSDKKFWDYLDLLIVPAALAIGVYWLNRTLDDRQRKVEEDRSKRNREAQAAQKDHEVEVENQRAQDAALQSYLDQMSQLLTDKERPLHRARPRDTLSLVARARTLTVLARLNSERKGRVFQFLYESDLLTRGRAIVDLQGADLKGVDLYIASLRGVCLNGADLTAARLDGANLTDASLNGAKLGAYYEVSFVYESLGEVPPPGSKMVRKSTEPGSSPSVYRLDMHAAGLTRAVLSGADLENAYLNEASLNGADLRGAYLSGADLSNTNLRDAQGVTEEQLNQAKSLEGATMPNGQKYEDWLKSKDQEKNKKSDGSS